MSHRLAIVFVSALALSAAAAPATAGEEMTLPRPRQGYYAGLSAYGVQARSHDAKVHSLGSLAGGAYSLRLGQMIVDWFGLGMALEGTSVTSERWRQSSGGLLVEAQVVPWRHLAVHGGAGLGVALATDRRGLIVESKGTGGAYYSVALSYDFFPLHGGDSGGWAVRPEVALKALPGSSYNSLMVWAGVAVVRWSGLDRSELQLSDDQAFAPDR
jgi:hypothetical protein